MLVDNAAMQLATRPEQFDVLVMENTFGDILSDLAAAVTGGLGLAPSASLGDGGTRALRAGARLGARHRGAGSGQPGGDAADGTALLLRHGLGREDEATRLEAAVDVGLRERPTPDLGGNARTSELGDAVLGAL